MQHVIQKFFADKTHILLWHDVVNNSLSAYPGNNFTPLSPECFLKNVLDYQQVKTVLYVQRTGTPDIFGLLGSQKFLALHVLTDIISKRKAKSKDLLRKYRELHQPGFLELKTLGIISRYSANLSALVKKSRKRMNLKRRLALKKKPIACTV